MTISGRKKPDEAKIRRGVERRNEMKEGKTIQVPVRRVRNRKDLDSLYASVIRGAYESNKKQQVRPEKKMDFFSSPHFSAFFNQFLYQ